VEIANGVEAVMDGRIYIECVNAPFLALLEAPAMTSAPGSSAPSLSAVAARERDVSAVH